MQNLIPSTQADVCPPKPIHRLDYPTTGLLLIGKTRTSIIALNKLFEQKKIEKKYLAVSIGKMKSPYGIIKDDIDEKEAESHYQVIQTVASERFEYLNLLELSPKTGRRHQLRKHLATLGNPLLGDKEYGIEGLILNGKGLYLHAYSLDFIHPITEEVISIKDSIPKRFRKLFDFEV